MNSRITNLCGYVGPVLVLAGAITWVVIISRPLISSVLLFTGSVMLTINRFVSRKSDYFKSRDSSMPLNLRRLYRQRCVGSILLLLSSIMMFIPDGFYFGFYYRRSLWILPFIVFTVIELYSAFRIPAVEKSINRQ